MPYRRLPKTDSARLRALKTLLDSNDIYTVRGRFISWDTLNRAQSAHDRLFTAVQQYKVTLAAQTRHTTKIAKLQRNATVYVSHFLQVLLLAVERGEIKKSQLSYYELQPDATTLPNIKTVDRLMEWGKRVIDGEKARVKKGGRPIYNPTISMVETHFDIFTSIISQQRTMLQRTQQALTALKELRPEVDEIILDLWNQIEAQYIAEPWPERMAHCSQLGVIYYRRRGEQDGSDEETDNS